MGLLERKGVINETDTTSMEKKKPGGISRKFLDAAKDGRLMNAAYQSNIIIID